LRVFMQIFKTNLLYSGQVLIPILIVPAMGGNPHDLSEVICTMFFVSGIITLLQTFFGDRLPIIQVGNLTFSLNRTWMAIVVGAKTQNLLYGRVSTAQGGSFAFITPALAIAASIKVNSILHLIPTGPPSLLKACPVTWNFTLINSVMYALACTFGEVLGPCICWSCPACRSIQDVAFWAGLDWLNMPLQNDPQYNWAATNSADGSNHQRFLVRPPSHPVLTTVGAGIWLSVLMAVDLLDGSQTPEAL